jgi:hypothetical protein
MTRKKERKEKKRNLKKRKVKTGVGGFQLGGKAFIICLTLL